MDRKRSTQNKKTRTPVFLDTFSVACQVESQSDLAFETLSVRTCSRRFRVVTLERRTTCSLHEEAIKARKKKT